MNKGILQLALSGTVALELEYREPLKETDEQFLIAQLLLKFNQLTKVGIHWLWVIEVSQMLRIVTPCKK